MRVLHVITGLQAGGAERQLALLAGHSRAEVEVLSLTGGGLVADALRACGVRVTELGMRGNRDLLALPRLWRAVRAGRYDVVHLHLFRSLVFGVPAARAAGVPRVVFTEHSLGAELVEGRRVTRGVRLLYALLTRLVDVVVAVSQDTCAQLLRAGVPSERILVLPNGLDRDALLAGQQRAAAHRLALGVPVQARLLLAVGRLVPSKRLDALLDAVAPLLGPDLRLVVVGAGPERIALERQAAELGIGGLVCFVGESDDVPGLLAAADLLVSSSPAETFGLAVVEARLVGLPVVCVSCPAVDELGVSDPGLRRSTASPDALRAAVQAGLTGTEPGFRVPPPPRLATAYDATATAAALDALYAGRPVLAAEPAPLIPDPEVTAA